MDVITYALCKGNGGGSGGGVLVVTDTDGTLDKTWQEIHDAAFAVIKESFIEEGTTAIYPVMQVSTNGGSGPYSVASNDPVYEASSASDYPVLQS